jgi:hypothetical protein
LLGTYARFAGLLVFALALNGCGGSSGGGNNSGGSGSPPPANTPLQGVYGGTTSDGSTFESIVLPNNKYYALYGVTTGNTFVIDGMMAGNTISNNGNFSASITDYYYTGSLSTGTVTGSYASGVNVSGTVSELGKTPVSFTGTTAATSPPNFNTAASLSSVTGNWSGNLEGGTAMSLTVQPNGNFSGINTQGCSFSGTLTPDTSNKNFFDLSLIPGTGCSYSGLSVSGIAVSYPLSNGTNQILAGGVASANSNVALEFSATTVATTTTTLTANPNPVTVGSSVTFTASVTSSGSAIPTGTVAFRDGATVLGSSSLNSSGLATFLTSSLSAGSHSITAIYGGNATNGSSTSSVLSETVNAAVSATTTALSASPNPAVLGTSVTFTAAVTTSGSNVPTGTVTFKDGATVLGGTALNASGTATYSTTGLSTGSHSITALYGGDSKNSGSTSSLWSETVNAAPATTTTTLTANLNPITVGSLVTFTTKVTSSGSNVPTGTVTFKDGAAVLGSTPLNASGMATLSSYLTSGVHSITAVYGGDSQNGASTSSVWSETVQ